MKRFAIAGVAALALTMACQQKAAAWGWQLTGNFGISIGADFTCWGDCCAPGCNGAPGGGYSPSWNAPPAYSAPHPYYVGAYAPEAANGTAHQAAPAAQPRAPAVAAQPSVQPIGYYYYGAYGYGNYGYYQVPSYWYGR